MSLQLLVFSHASPQMVMIFPWAQQSVSLQTPSRRRISGGGSLRSGKGRNGGSLIVLFQRPLVSPVPSTFPHTHYQIRTGDKQDHVVCPFANREQCSLELRAGGLRSHC